MSVGIFRTRRNALVFVSITALGVSSIITQLTVMRELLSLFAGNELVVGVVLANWLLLTGVGPLIELWNKARFDQEMKQTQKNFREIASSVVELGTS